jgi:hypothetical protein
MLPALIIILNELFQKDEAWVSDDHSAVINDFFSAIETVGITAAVGSSRHYCLIDSITSTDL